MALPALAASAASTAYDALPDQSKKDLKDWLQRSTGSVVSNVKQLANLVTKSEPTAAIVAEGLVRHGAPVDAVAKIFDGSANEAQIRASLTALGRTLVTTEDANRPGLSASVPDAAADRLRKELVQSLIRAFGSVENARKVQMALATLREQDFDWFNAVIGRR